MTNEKADPGAGKIAESPGAGRGVEVHQERHSNVFFKETKIPVLESYRRYKSSQNFHIDCLRVAPQTYIFLESGDRDLSIGVLGSGRKLFSSELQMETFAGPRIFR